MQRPGPALHEALEIHEIMGLKMTCAAKSSAMQGMTRDPELRSLLSEDVAHATRHLRELQNLIDNNARMG